MATGTDSATEPASPGDAGGSSTSIGPTWWIAGGFAVVAGVVVWAGVAGWLPIGLNGNAGEDGRATMSAPIHEIEVVAEYPHDPRAYCQGLIYVDGEFYESTGHYGQSTVRRVEIATGRPRQVQPLGRRHFGEGLVLLGDELVQLTWKARLGLVYDRKTLRRRRTFRYAGEGWGLTYDGTHLVMSDGTSRLRFLDPKTFKVVRTLDVKDGRRAVDELNELEYVEGQIWANVWYSDYIARIDPKSGQVVGWIDCSSLYPARLRAQRDYVLNGIAYDEKNERVYVTGKNWPKVFQIRVKPAVGAGG